MYLRLKKNNDFQKLFTRGNKSFSSSLVMLYSKSNALKMGISIGKKHGGSVQRNHIKRLIRAAFQDVVSNIDGNYNIVFVPRINVCHSYENSKKNMLKMLKKEGIYKLND